MKERQWTPKAWPLLLLFCASGSQASGPAGQLGTGQGDFGGVGLMQVPSARMAPQGSMSAGWNRTQPYRRYTVFFQPTSWFEGGFRYVEVENREFVAAGDGRANLDKGADIKLRLLDETRYWPDLALGFRDLGGTTLFGAEYLVASKRWYDFDVTLGVGWGYLGNADDIDSPFGWLNDAFDERPNRAGGDQGGELAFSQLFRGPASLFGGIEYQTPWDPLVLQVEYEGNDYRNEPQRNTQRQDSRFNWGARLALSDNVEVRAGWQRGNTLMTGIHFNVDLAGISQVKYDPPPMPLGAPPQASWDQVAEMLENNAGMRVARISRDADALRVEAEPLAYRALPQSEGRASRILHAQADDEVGRFHFRWSQRGLGLRESVHDRDSFVAALASAEREVDHRYGVYAHARLEEDQGETLYQASPQRFQWGLGPRLDQNFGGPDGYLYRLLATLNAEYQTSRHGWLSGTLSYTLIDNLDNYEYIADSELPRVRTFIGDYLSASEFGIENLQYTHTTQLSDDWFAMGYGGLLEMMYAGVGGELLYRPFERRWALGLDLNWVRQREFDQRFEMRDYSTWTGHISAYIDTDIEDVLAKISVGRYLAGDYGVTFDVSREFASGARIGAWATLTDAGSDFGEGSFDKGLYLAIPFDAFFTRSTRDMARISWQPLTRDGGARLGRRYPLYDLTEERHMGRYWQQLGRLWE